nr:hypothetical protein [Tanacetum cinerariifolium]
MSSLAPGIEIEKRIIDTLVTVLNYEEMIRTDGKDLRRRYFPTDVVDKMETNNNGESSHSTSLSGDRVDRPGPEEPGSDGPVDGTKARPMSPATLALMCDEGDTMFVESTNINGLRDHGADHFPNGQVITETYAEQEKILLTMFRDCLNKFITFGELKETQCSSLARNDFRSQSQIKPVESSTTNTLQVPFINGFPKAASSQNNQNYTNMKIPSHAGNSDLRVTVLNYEERIRTDGKDLRRHYFPTDAVVKEYQEKDKNRIKTGQKREAWQSQEKFKAVAVERGRKTEENKKRMAENAYTYQKLFNFKIKKKRKGPDMQFFQSINHRG